MKPFGDKTPYEIIQNVELVKPGEEKPWQHSGFGSYIHGVHMGMAAMIASQIRYLNSREREE